MNPKIDDLAARQFTPTGHDDGMDAAREQEEKEQAASMAALEAGAVKVIFGLLKMARALIARKLPEIMDEWTDPALQEPAKAAIPVIRKYMDRAMMLLGSNPEIAGLCMALMPLGLGYMAAADRHDKTPPADVVENVQPIHAI